MARRLSSLEVHQVKLLICEGFSQTDVARVLDLSQGTVSKICLGDTHRDIAWPNLAVGEKLMRKRGVRSEQDQAQARLVSGVPQAVPQLPEPREVIQTSESEAIEQAREEVKKRQALREEIFRRAEVVEKEMDAEFLAAVTNVSEEIDQTDPKRMASAWEVDFLPWEEVVGRAEDLDLVKVVEDNPDEVTQRAIGIVFLRENLEDWGSGQTLKKITSIVELLKETQKDAN